MKNKILTLASEMKDLRSKWQTLSLYERFEQTVVGVLTLVIAVIVAIATWQLILHTFKLVKSHLVDPADPEVFQGLFGMVFTVLIALEFKHTLPVVKRHRGAIVQVRAVCPDRAACTGAQIHHSRSLSDYSECHSGSRRGSSGSRGRILARSEPRRGTGRGDAGVIVAPTAKRQRRE